MHVVQHPCCIRSTWLSAFTTVNKVYICVNNTQGQGFLSKTWFQRLSYTKSNMIQSLNNFFELNLCGERMNYNKFGGVK